MSLSSWNMKTGEIKIKISFKTPITRHSSLFITIYTWTKHQQSFDINFFEVSHRAGKLDIWCMLWHITLRCRNDIKVLSRGKIAKKRIFSLWSHTNQNSHFVGDSKNMLQMFTRSEKKVPTEINFIFPLRAYLNVIIERPLTDSRELWFI